MSEKKYTDTDLPSGKTKVASLVNRLEYKQKKRRLQKRIKIPVWVSMGILILIITAVSTIVSYTITDKAMDRLIKRIPHLESEYISETGRYPDWFTEWMNTVYLKGEG